MEIGAGDRGLDGKEMRHRWAVVELKMRGESVGEKEANGNGDRDGG